jgi:hypothetical protein
VNERTAVIAGSIAGAVAGIAVAYLFFTDRGRAFRQDIEPTIDRLKADFVRFQQTVEKFGAMASDGARAFQEFSAGRSPGKFADDTTSH